MSRNTKDYSQGKIYCIRNSISDDIYIGSTCQSLSQRMAQHRLDKRREKHQNRSIYKLMNEVDDDNVFYIELVEDYPCENHYQLRKRGGELKREMKPTLNKQIECRTAKEYQTTYREYFNQYKKKYYIENKEYLNECNRQNYEKNRENH